MHVLIADKLPPMAVSDLEAAGIEVTLQPTLKDDALTDAIASTGAEVLIVRSTKVTAAMLEAGRLGLVVRAGAGTNTIDIAAASAGGIYVANCPGKNSLAVAELAIGFLVALDRRIPDATAQLRAGQWNKKEFSKARGLAGRTLGVVGAGRIGLAVAERALALGMKVLVHDRSPSRAGAVTELGARFESNLRGMLGLCDAISLHAPATPETRHIVGPSFLSAMKPGAYLINTSRAELVDEGALLNAIADRGIRAAVDVFYGEVSGGVGEVDSDLLRDPNVISTPHIGASTDQAQEAVAAEAVRIVLDYQATGAVPNVVNVSQRSPAQFLLIVRHLNRVGVLSRVFAALKDADINVQETENIVFAGAEACIARIAISAPPPQAVLESLLADHEDILGTSLVPLERS
ncbi:MAG: hydroxyacid dehydrogenase [Proteobacteria bacterium]|nr:hydroxyacid dehydrogenase [Pseudomonadota bacterium]